MSSRYVYMELFSNLTQFGEMGPYDTIINDPADKPNTCWEEAAYEV